MTCDEGHMAPQIETGLRLQNLEHRQTHGHECGLGVDGQRQFPLGTFEHQFRQRLIQGIVDSGKDRPGSSEGFRESLAHAGRL